MGFQFQIQNLENSVVLITGASSGIGEAIAMSFAELKCKVILVARREEKLNQVKADILQKIKVPIHIVTLDIQNIEQIQKLPETLPSEFKEVDILVNNAGLGIGSGPIHELKLSDALVTLNTNINAVFAFSRVFTPGMVKRQKGHIINISSIAAQENQAGMSAYHASKHALRSLSNCMRYDLIATPIRVTDISPGIVETQFFQTQNTEGLGAELKKSIGGILKQIKTNLLPSDIADNVVYAATRPPNVQIAEILVLPTNQAGLSTAK